MKTTWKDFTKESQVGRMIPTVSDEDAIRIDSDARSSGKPALRAPTRLELMNRIMADRNASRGELRAPLSQMKANNESAITDAVMNTVGRIRRGEYGDAFNGIIGALTEVGGGYKARGGQKGSPYMNMRRPKGWVRPAYDASRLAAAGYVADRSGRPVTKKMLAGNLYNTDPSLVDSTAITSMPRWKLRSLLNSGIPRYEDGREAPASLRGSTIRGLTTEAIIEAARRGYETWPSTNYAHVDHPGIVSYDKSKSVVNKGRRRANQSEDAAVVYSREADKIQSILTDGDSWSPTSRDVLEALSSGKSRKDIIRKWFDLQRGDVLGRQYYWDEGNEIGLRPKMKHLLIENANGDFNKEQEALRRIMGTRSLYNNSNYMVAERKFIGDVPFDASAIRAAFLPTDASLGHKAQYNNVINELNRLDIPFVSFRNFFRPIRRVRVPGDFGFSNPVPRDYESASTEDKRAIGVLNGVLEPLRNQQDIP